MERKNVCCLGAKLVPFTKRQNFRLVQIENICRRQNKSTGNIRNRNFGWVENIVGKGGLAETSIFSFPKKYFLKTSFPGFLKVRTVRSRVNHLPNHKILDWPKMKVFADNKVAKIFSFSHNVFQRFLFQAH